MPWAYERLDQVKANLEVFQKHQLAKFRSSYYVKAPRNKESA